MLRILLPVFALSYGPSLFAETPGQAYLLNGQVVAGWIQKVEPGGVVWKTAAGRIGTFPMDDIREIRFVMPADYLTAVKQLDSDSNEEAIAVLTAYADTTNPENYYPVPGNFVSMAARALFSHYRKEGQVEEAAFWALRNEPNLLPQTETPPLLELYRLLAAPPDETFFPKTVELLDEDNFLKSREIEYLIAAAHELRGEHLQALAAYARVFSPAGGVLNPYGEFAIQRSILLLENYPPPGLAQPAQLIESLYKTQDLLYGTRPKN